MKGKRVFGLILLLVFCSVVCRMFFSTNSSKEVVFIENIGADPASLNPHNIDDSVSWRVAMDIYEGLVNYDQDSNLVCTGAESYEISADGRTYIFKLRNNAKWSNGDEVTAYDYVFAFRRAVNPSTLARGYLSELLYIQNASDISKGLRAKEELGVYADDKYTLRIELEAANSEFIHYLTLWVAAPLHRKTVEEKGMEWSSDPRTIICNGPYVITEWVHNNRIVLKKNEYYWDKENVSIEKVKFIMLEDGAVDLNMFRTGNVHITDNKLPEQSREVYAKEFGDKYRVYKILCQMRLTINLNIEKFKDIRVRKALSIALDRDVIAKKVMRDTDVSYNIVPENVAHSEYKYDLEDEEEFEWIKWEMKERNEYARKLLIEAGYSEEHPLVIEIASRSSDKDRRVMSAIADIYNSNFRGLVVCKTVFYDWKTFLDGMEKGKYEIIANKWVADYDLASNFLALCTSKNQCNFCFYKDDKYDEMFDESLKLSQMEYNVLQHECNKYVSKQYIIIPYALMTVKKLVSDKIEGFKCDKNVLDRYSTKYLRFKEW